MARQENPYCELVTQVIAEIGSNFSLEEVKDFFAKLVKSKRSLGRVKSLRDLFHLLEKRDLLNSKKVTLLRSLGEKLQNETVKDLVHSYVKLCLDEETDGSTCSICGILHQTEDPLREQQNANINVRNNFDVDTDLSQAIENVALNIGQKWGVLARELKILEVQIDMCIQTHPGNPVAQARMALEFWRQNEQENADMNRLDKALEARLCKNFGFGKHLRRSIIRQIS